MTADRILRELASQAEDTIGGYKITRLQHALQSATRAERDNADPDWVIAALLHDIGDGLAPQNHDIFQMVYYAHHYEGWNQYEREKFSDHPYYHSCVEFCERWDQSSFDPDYHMQPLAHFEPLVHEVFKRPVYDAEVLQPGVVKGLPATA